jgi:hypothetical protein
MMPSKFRAPVPLCQARPPEQTVLSVADGKETEEIRF